jgi:hypothetical protein
MPNSNDIHLRIKETIARLIRLSRQMRQHVRKKWNAEADRFDPKDQDGKPFALVFERHIDWKLSTHPEWKTGNDMIKDRLRKTMLRRWRRVFFTSDRASADSVVLKVPLLVEEHASKPKTTEAPKTVNSHFTGIAHLIPEKPPTEAAPSEALLSVEPTIGPSFQPQGNSGSIVSSRRTKSLMGVKPIDFPKAPMMSADFLSFMCPLCGISQPAAEREHQNWR